MDISNVKQLIIKSQLIKSLCFIQSHSAFALQPAGFCKSISTLAGNNKLAVDVPIRRVVIVIINLKTLLELDEYLGVWNLP